jgi:drug/metabolite transporter (DMT)-like permease
MVASPRYRNATFDLQREHTNRHPMVSVGILLALMASVSWALANVLTQRLGKRIGPPPAMLWSMVAGALLAIPLALVLDERTAPLDAGVAVWAVVASVAAVVAYVGLFYAFATEELTIAVPIVSSWPLLAGVVAVVFLGESIGGLRLVGAAAVLVGVVLVSLPGRLGPPNRRALTAAAGAAIGFGLMVPALGRIAPATGAFGGTALVNALGAVLAFPLAKVARVSVRPPPLAAWGLVFATGAAEAAGFVAVAFARRFAPMTLVAPVASLAGTLTVLYAWLLLRERPRAVVIAGALLAGAGVVLLAS